MPYLRVLAIDGLIYIVVLMPVVVATAGGRVVIVSTLPREATAEAVKAPSNRSALLLAVPKMPPGVNQRTL